MRINKSVLCTNFGDPWLRDRELTHKTIKKLRFWLKKSIDSAITQKPLATQSWILYTMWMLINDLRKLSLEAPG